MSMGFRVLSIVSLFVMIISGAARAQVWNGADRISEPGFARILKNKRVGILAHAASRLRDGRHVVDVLHADPKLDLKMIFTPEHGLRGTSDDEVPDTRDPQTGLPVYSLYGPRRAPTRELLAQIDVLLIDLQDVGVRFYTYPATVAWTLQACKNAKVQVVLLDRPNPLGALPQGAVLDPRYRGRMTSFYPTTTLHAMTLGELARMYNEELGIDADLTVVPMLGWKHSRLFQDTGLRWDAPSPALLSPEQGELYGAFGALETLNLAVGRGLTNDDAFRLYGAPWITREKAHALTRELEALNLPGLRFSDAEWTPTRREFKGRRCRGFRVGIVDPQRVEYFKSLVSVLSVMHRWLGAKLNIGGVDQSIGAAWVRQAIMMGKTPSEIVEKARAEAKGFETERARALIYE